MLQIVVEHYKDGTVSVQEIRNDSDVLSVMQDNGIYDREIKPLLENSKTTNEVVEK